MGLFNKFNAALEVSLWHMFGNNAGSVHFHPAPHGRGTEVKIVIRYTPPAGALGAAFAKLFQENPEQQIVEDLRRFKSLIEAGEVPTTAGQPTGSSSPLADSTRVT